MRVREYFGEGGKLASKLPGYRPREGQVQLAEAIDDAIFRQKHLIAEAPTGTGKSIAYLVPSILRAISERGKYERSKAVIVVTANIALQEQLVKKDLPFLKETLGVPFKFALMKGRNNYVCQDALAKEEARSVLGSDPRAEALLEWARTTETGDVSEFPDTPNPAAWRRLAVGSDECKGSACRYSSTCFANLARAEAATADVIVTNYHLFFAHLVIREKIRKRQAEGHPGDPDHLLPPASTIIFDEAHKAADIARDFLGFQITKGSVDWVIRGLGQDVHSEAKQEADAFFAACLSLRRSKKYRARLKEGHGLDGVPFSRAMERVADHCKQILSGSAWSSDERAEYEAKLRRAKTIASQLLEATSPETNQDSVYFLEETLGKVPGVAVKSKPIEVAPFMAEALFGQFPTVVLTSATLATGGSNPFAFVRKEMGITTATDLQVESPFDWASNAMLVIPRTMPDPKAEAAKYPAAVARHVREIVVAAKGRTLSLHTSNKLMDLAHRECSGLMYRVLKQGDAPRTRLINEFKADTSSVLFGVESFWAGIDIPGESLSCVVIDRLPFATPDDPLVDAIASRSDRWFFEFAIPRATIQLRQGLGRLIRTETDRGVVVVLDRRLVTMGYGRSMLGSLPKMRVADEVEDVSKFFAASR